MRSNPFFILLTRAYAHNKHAIRKNALLAVVLELLAVAVLYYLNQTYGNLYNGIEAYDTTKIYTSIGLFAGLAFLMVLINGYMSFFINRLAFELRLGLTEFELRRESIVLVQNYGQRVQEDLRKFSDSVCDITFAILKASLHVPVFIGVVISVTSWYIGLAVVVAVIGGTILTRLVARRLVEAQSIQESNEAMFRRNMDANYNPGLHFSHIVSQSRVLNGLFKRLAFTQSGIGQGFVLLPFIFLLPVYLSHSIAFGDFMRSVRALNTVVESLSVLIDNRQTLLVIETCVLRLEPLLKE